jgi:hypothetical protein
MPAEEKAWLSSKEQKAEARGQAATCLLASAFCSLEL